MKEIHLCLSTILLSVAINMAYAQNKTNNDIRADQVPAGEIGRSYLPGAAAGNDAIRPGSYTDQFKINARFRAGFSQSCGDMDFYQNIQAEIKSLQYKMQNTIKSAQKSAMASISGAMTGFFQYTLMKINPTLGQLSTKTLDEQLELFNLKVKQCRDYERDVQNGKNPLGEMAEIAIGEQWRKTIGLVNSGEISLEEAEKELLREAQKSGLTMSDGKQYGGQNQAPINLTQDLLKAGMNLMMGRTDKDNWDSAFTGDVKDNPILKEFKSPKALHDFIAEIYGSTETRINASAASGNAIENTPGRGYEKVYVRYRDEYLKSLRAYIEGNLDRKSFETETGHVIPPAEIDDIRRMSPYAKAVEIEARAQQFAIQRLRNNLLFAKQALKTGIYAPDLQQSSIKAPAEREYKSLYYRILDDIAEVGQRAYQY